MISAWWLFLVPLSFFFGFACMALLAIGHNSHEYWKGYKARDEEITGARHR